MDVRHENLDAKTSVAKSLKIVTASTPVADIQLLSSKDEAELQLDATVEKIIGENSIDYHQKNIAKYAKIVNDRRQLLSLEICQEDPEVKAMCAGLYYSALERYNELLDSENIAASMKTPVSDQGDVSSDNEPDDSLALESSEEPPAPLPPLTPNPSLVGVFSTWPRSSSGDIPKNLSQQESTNRSSP